MALTNQQRLDAATLAFHNLVTGVSARVVVDQNGERVEYTSANRQALQAYITFLQNLIANGASTRGPIKTWLQ